MNVKFTATKEDMRLISIIADRAIEIGKKHKFIRPKIKWVMDLEATHCNGNELNLERLLKADDFNFAHDVFGIANHLNRQTGQLENCFVPRFSV